MHPARRPPAASRMMLRYAAAAAPLGRRRHRTLRMDDIIPPLITLDRVDVETDGAPILHRISWQLAPGEHWGVIGRNGSGKSTLLGLLAGTRWPAPDRGLRTYDFGGGAERDAVRARRKITL